MERKNDEGSTATKPAPVRPLSTWAQIWTGVWVFLQVLFWAAVLGVGYWLVKTNVLDKYDALNRVEREVDRASHVDTVAIDPDL